MQCVQRYVASSCGLRLIDIGKIMEQGEGVTREPRVLAIPNPPFSRNYAIETLLLEEIFKNVRQKIREISRTCISVNAQTRQCWKVHFKTKVCSNSGSSTLAMLWIKEVEIAKSVDDLLTSRSIEVGDFTDLEMLDAKMASAVKKIKSNPHF